MIYLEPFNLYKNDFAETTKSKLNPFEEQKKFCPIYKTVKFRGVS
jgi:hypothetical protein